MTAKTPQLSAPPAFVTARAEVGAAVWRPELHVEEIPAPTRIAPYALAISGDVVVHGEDIGSGRLILLHDPAGNPAWDGDFRCVSYAKATVDADMGGDPMLCDVGWSWLMEALELHDCGYRAPAGTVTMVTSKSFGTMAGEPTTAEVEVRASWTPVLDVRGHGFAPHLAAWGALVGLAAGLPPLPADVAVLSSRGRRR